MRRTLLVAVLLLAIPAGALGGPLGLSLGEGRGLFQGTLPSLQQGLSLRYDSRWGSSALWWGTIPLRPRPNIEIDLLMSAHLSGIDNASWIPGVQLTWRPWEKFLVRAQWTGIAPLRRWQSHRTSGWPTSLQRSAWSADELD